MRNQTYKYQELLATVTSNVSKYLLPLLSEAGSFCPEQADSFVIAQGNIQATRSIE